jgi:hypothetical protein
MSPRGRGSHGPVASDRPRVLWWLGMIAAALVGGLAAARLGHASLWVAVVVSLVLGVVFAAIPWPAPSADRTRIESFPPSGPVAPSGSASPGGDVPYPGPAAPAGGARPSSSPAGAFGEPNEPDGIPGRGASAGTGPSESVVQLLPITPGHGGNAPWYEAAQGAVPAPSRDAQRAPAPDLSTYLASTLIAQCPRCGAFGLDYRQERDGLGFRCQSCEYTWTWRPGTPWPPVRVMPARRKEPPRSAF